MVQFFPPPPATPGNSEKNRSPGVGHSEQFGPRGGEFGKKIPGVGNSEKNPKGKKFAKKTLGGDGYNAT